MTQLECTRKEINLDNYSKLVDENIHKIIDKLDFVDNHTMQITLKASNIENFSKLVAILLKNCQKLETLSLFSN